MLVFAIYFIRLRHSSGRMKKFGMASRRRARESNKIAENESVFVSHRSRSVCVLSNPMASGAYGIPHACHFIDLNNILFIIKSCGTLSPPNEVCSPIEPNTRAKCMGAGALYWCARRWNAIYTIACTSSGLREKCLIIVCIPSHNAHGPRNSPFATHCSDWLRINSNERSITLQYRRKAAFYSA